MIVPLAARGRFRAVLHRAFVLALVLVSGTEVAGCAAARRAREAAPDRTGGLTVQLRITDVNAGVLYRVEPDGTLRFGGGADALNDRFSWTGALTDEEIASLRALVEEQGLFEHAPAARPGSGTRRCELHLQGPEGRRRYRFEGESTAVAPVEALLEQASRRRLEGFLRQMPRRPEPDES